MESHQFTIQIYCLKFNANSMPQWSHVKSHCKDLVYNSMSRQITIQIYCLYIYAKSMPQWRHINSHCKDLVYNSMLIQCHNGVTIQNINTLS